MGAGEGTADLATDVRSQPAELTWDDQPRVSPWRVLRGVLIVVLILFVVVGAVVGVRPSTLAHLEAEVAAGDVDVVQIAGGLPAGASGYGTAEVTWRQGWFEYGVEVVEARPRSEARSLRRSGEARVVRNLGARLTEIRPDVKVVRTDHSTTSSSSMLGWRLPGWMGWVAFAILLGSLALLVGGPRPWRATRWAWFWLCFLVPLVGVAAFLLLGGPSRVVPPPRAGAGRLKGGWAFLLATLLAAALTPNS